jgi:hypothetical protein
MGATLCIWGTKAPPAPAGNDIDAAASAQARKAQHAGNEDDLGIPDFLRRNVEDAHE